MGVFYAHLKNVVSLRVHMRHADRRWEPAGIAALQGVGSHRASEPRPGSGVLLRAHHQRSASRRATPHAVRPGAAPHAPKIRSFRWLRIEIFPR
ncbi:hypothetical protein NITHO_840007 [Nitrolancea hollandica Lb]|uniref:Uncharacterized protein n=1 Tax=Nitrolancea hollandica Lb TaxID=1129897 RepID=I4ENC2_9BACT|nr:hypothetical protein NITHO_840007 [Nitrolancea hollandica Lb]